VDIIQRSDIDEIRAKFMDNVDVTKDCWEWRRYKSEQGYGITSKYCGKTRWRAHRLAYELFNGPIPDGLQIDHLCRNRGCVNPSHLEAVTHKENTLRGIGVTAINKRKTRCYRGHPFTGDNYIINYRGERMCRTCRRESCLRYRGNDTTRLRYIAQTGVEPEVVGYTGKAGAQ
jgi:hypothetical protein